MVLRRRTTRQPGSVSGTGAGRVPPGTRPRPCQIRTNREGLDRCEGMWTLSRQARNASEPLTGPSLSGRRSRPLAGPGDAELGGPGASSTTGCCSGSRARSARPLHVLRARLDGGIRNKAVRGEIFKRFAVCGSARGVWLWLREQELAFPLRHAVPPRTRLYPVPLPPGRSPSSRTVRGDGRQRREHGSRKPATTFGRTSADDEHTTLLIMALSSGDGDAPLFTGPRGGRNCHRGPA
jgi:hypothetical protein